MIREQQQYIGIQDFSMPEPDSLRREFVQGVLNLSRGGKKPAFYKRGSMPGYATGPGEIYYIVPTNQEEANLMGSDEFKAEVDARNALDYKGDYRRMNRTRYGIRIQTYHPRVLDIVEDVLEEHKHRRVYP